MTATATSLREINQNIVPWHRLATSHNKIDLRVLPGAGQGKPNVIFFLDICRGGSASDVLGEGSGDDAEETRRMNAYLDDYVDKLIASVDLSTEDQTDSIYALNQTFPDDPETDDSVKTSIAINITDDETVTGEFDSDEDKSNESNLSPLDLPQATISSTLKEPNQIHPATSIESASNSTDPALRTHESKKASQHAVPNLIYRLLLPLGLIGRAIVMFCIMIAELLHHYIPELYVVLKWFFTTIGVYDPLARSSRRRPLHTSMKPKGSGQLEVNTQYSAFISSDATGGKKASKEQKKAVDALALEKLSMLGTTREAKYRHLSEAFMKKYNLGKYAKEQKAYESIIAPSIKELYMDSRKQVDQQATDESDDEEDDWVVKALASDDIRAVDRLPSIDGVTETKEGKVSAEETNRKKKRRRKKSVPFTITNVEPTATISTSGSAIGLSFSIGFNGKKSKSKMLEAAAASRTDHGKKKRKVKPMASDREGGGGVLGRIRAVGANNPLSSRLLGAYSLDAPSREEAGDARGIIEIAKRYGYGEWSDNDSDDSSEDRIFRSVSQSKRRPHAKLHRMRHRERIKEPSERSKDNESEKKSSGPFLPMSRTKDLNRKKLNTMLL
jgi:hypothetical protein